jgi:hypothetical protein
MPTLEIEGFRLTINSRDERGHGAHAHVRLAPYRVVGMKRRNIARARELVGENFGQLMEWWIEFNG